ncbi:nuclear transport factor 2 family protein [Duganella sp. sic0402]|nr:nuclear transport factor 2 family protein [Duganella sp. sic0402]
MKRLLMLLLLVASPLLSQAADATDTQSIKRAVRDYIESQHKADPERMARGIDPQLAKRTYWRAADGSEFVMNTDYDSMLKVARTYNKDGTKFPAQPRVEIKILDVDQRVATVKLTADEWIDYMHLYKNQHSEWKIVNVLWQYHDTTRQASKKQ